MLYIKFEQNLAQTSFLEYWNPKSANGEIALTNSSHASCQSLQKIMYMVAVLIWHFKQNVILYYIKWHFKKCHILSLKNDIYNVALYIILF